MTIELALKYIAAHPTRYLFPLDAGRKGRPLIKDNLAQASNDPAQLKEWHDRFPGCWWGVSAKKSGLVIVDIDAGPGKEGKQAVAALKAAGFTFPPTEMQRSQSGGWHLIYTGEHHFSASKIGKHIDTPNYIVIAGCGKYRKANDFAAVPCPDWIADRIKPRSTAPRVAVGTPVPLDTFKKMLDATTYDGRHEYDDWLAFAMAAHESAGGDEADYLAAFIEWCLNDPAGKESWTAESIERHWHSFTAEPPENEAAITRASWFKVLHDLGQGDLVSDATAAADFAGDPPPPLTPEEAARKPPKREIVFDPIEMPKMIEKTQSALMIMDGHDPIFRRGPHLVRLNQNVTDDDPDKKSKEPIRKKGALVIREIVLPYMMTRLAESIRYIVVKPEKGVRLKKGEKRKMLRLPIPVPASLVTQLLAAETTWRLPWLEGVIEAPTIRLDGTLLTTPGYDAETCIYFDARNMLDLPPFAEAPTIEDARAGLAVLLDVLDEFEFEDEVSKAVALAAILTAMVRRVLPIAPAFLIDAPGQSNGKTLLADLIATIATGREAGAAQYADGPEEQAKLFGAILLGGDAVVNFDNITTPIGGKTVCGVITSSGDTKVRLLGQSAMIAMPARVTWLFTGNNMTVKDDMATRALRCRLDARCEFPDQRTFKRKDLLAYVRANRPALIHAALTIVRAHIVAGKPGAEAIRGRFNEWGELIAGSLVWLGQPNPCDSRSGVIADDPVRETRNTLLRAWHEQYGLDAWVTAAQLNEFAGDVGMALAAIEGGGNSSNAVSGKLKTFEGVIIDGVFLEKRPYTNNAPSAWRLQEHELQPWD